MFAYASLSLNKTMTVMKIRTNHLCPLCKEDGETSLQICSRNDSRWNSL